MKVKNQVPEEKKKAVVYQVPCKDCHQLYMGETEWTLKVRLAEHRRAVQKSDVNNGIAMHVANTSHNIDWANARVVNSNRVLGEENHRSHSDQEELLYCSITSYLNATNAAMSLYQINKAYIRASLLMISGAREVQ